MEAGILILGGIVSALGLFCYVATGIKTGDWRLSEFQDYRTWQWKWWKIKPLGLPIKAVRRVLKWLERVDLRRRRRQGLICSCAKPEQAFGHSEYCFGCRKSTGM